MTNRRASPGKTVTIAHKFRGPPNSGNGGYVAGVFADFLGVQGPVEVTLRSPVPLDASMTVENRHDAETEYVTISRGDTLIAEARAAALQMDVPEPPARDAIVAAAPNSPSLLEGDNGLVPGRGFHPICFCCGADHEDGLEVFTAPVEDTDQVATVWQTRDAWASKDGLLPEEFLWTALDCPGQFAWYASGVLTGLLGRITAEILRPAPAGDDYIVLAWPIDIDGKKHFAGSAIFDGEHNLIAKAKSVWIGRREMAPMAN